MFLLCYFCILVSVPKHQLSSSPTWRLCSVVVSSFHFLILFPSLMNNNTISSGLLNQFIYLVNYIKMTICLECYALFATRVEWYALICALDMRIISKAHMALGTTHQTTFILNNGAGLLYGMCFVASFFRSDTSWVFNKENTKGRKFSLKPSLLPFLFFLYLFFFLFQVGFLAYSLILQPPTTS